MSAVEPLEELIAQRAPLSRLAELCDGLSGEERIAAVRGLDARAQATLFELADDTSRRVDLAWLVPVSVPPGATVRFLGKNSLPAFTWFEKRFTRSREAGLLIGHNAGPLQGIIGPGYFTALVRPGHPDELLFDYTRYPEAAPPGWPPLKRNERGLSYFVYRNLHDHVRPVGRHVAVGSANDASGKPKGQLFVLARGGLLGVPA